MTKLSLVLFLGVTICALEQVYSNGIYYYTDSQGAMAYQYAPYSPYVYAPYAFAASPDCDKNKEEGSSSSSSESSSSESSSEGESKEEGEGSSESSSSSSEEGGTTEEGEGSSSSSSSSEEGESKEGEGKKEEKKEKKSKAIFPPISYPFPPRPGQQVVYSSPVSYSYVPLKTYSLVQQPLSYPISSSYPYYSMSGYPVSAGYSAPVMKSYVASPVGRFAAPSIGKVSSAYSLPSVGKAVGYNPISSNIISAPPSYWSSGANLGYYKA